MGKMPLWKEAYQLSEEYRKHGIKMVYNQRTKEVYLSVLAAPLFVPNTTLCQSVGYLVVEGGVIASRDVEKWTEEVKKNFTRCWKNNLELLRYADTIV